MAYLIRDVGDIENKDNSSKMQYASLDEAKEFAMMHVENYKYGFEIIDTKTNTTVYVDKREEVSRTDLIDWD